MVRILFTGATGYIGSTLFTALLAHPLASTFAITALVRSEEKAAKIAALKLSGVRVVVGSHADAAVVAPLAEQADVVFATADCDDLAAAQAILAGLRTQHEATGAVPVLIHTSGTGVVAHLDAGAAPDFAPYSDTDVARLAAIPPRALHREVELVVFAAGAAGYARTYVVLPSVVWGRARNVLVDAGVANGRSLQIPHLIGAALARGAVGIVGEGENLWAGVELGELMQLYVLLFDAVHSDAPPPHGEAGYYFAASDEHKIRDVSEGVGRALVELGLIKSSVPEPFTQKDYDTIFASFGGQPIAELAFGSNCLVRADRALALGWKPTKTTVDLINGLKVEVEAYLTDLDKDKAKSA